MEGRRPPKKNLVGKVKGWLPFGKAGFRHRHKVERAKAHLRKVEFTLTDRGKLVSTAVQCMRQCVRVARCGAPFGRGCEVGHLHVDNQPSCAEFVLLS